MKLSEYMRDGADSYARAVLALLQGNIFEEDFKNLNHVFGIKVTRFDNCREQGYTVYLRNKQNKQLNISFAVYRCSDDLVIYRWEGETFNSPALSDMLDTDWDNKTYFAYNKVYEAYEFINKLIYEFVSEVTDEEDI